jgi:hypothetical protein
VFARHPPSERHCDEPVAGRPDEFQHQCGDTAIWGPCRNAMDLASIKQPAYLPAECYELS